METNDIHMKNGTYLIYAIILIVLTLGISWWKHIKRIWYEKIVMLEDFVTVRPRVLPWGELGMTFQCIQRRYVKLTLIVCLSYGWLLRSLKLSAIMKRLVSRMLREALEYEIRPWFNPATLQMLPRPCQPTLSHSPMQRQSPLPNSPPP